jgi:hypothetical protein
MSKQKNFPIVGIRIPAAWCTEGERMKSAIDGTGWIDIRKSPFCVVEKAIEDAKAGIVYERP